MEKIRIGWKEKHHLYHDRVIDLHVNQGLGYLKISQLVPVSKAGIRNWIATFVLDK
jgi:transposase